MGPLAAAFHGHPTAQLRVVGVTGTNGKTTTAFLVRHILESQGIQTGLLGTVHSVVGGNVEEVERTTPEAVDLQATFRRMLDAGDEACVMEVSSHALELFRAEGIEFDVAVFTNLTQDHLDFHGTLESYYAAKRQLFVPQSGAPPAAAVVNADDDWGEQLAAEITDAGRTPVATFAIERPRRLPRDRHRLRRIGRDVRVPRPRRFRGRTAPAARAVQRLQRARGDRLRARAGRGAARSGAGAASPRSACPAGSSPWTRARPSACWWTTRTLPTRSRTCSSPPAGCSSRQARAG